MNTAIMLVDRINKLLDVITSQNPDYRFRTGDLMGLLIMEAEVIGLHVMVVKRYGKLPLELFTLSETCTQTGIKIIESGGDHYKIAVPPEWLWRMLALKSGAQAIVDALEIERATQPDKPNRSKYKALFPLMDKLVATGTAVKTAALQLMNGDPKAARNFERVWQLRNQAGRAGRTGAKKTE